MPPPVQVTVLESATSYDYLQKVIVMGDAHTGKTRCIQRMYENIYREDAYHPTIGVDFCLKCFKVNDKVIRMQVWDTAGDARFRSITQAYYRGASAIVMCYSVDDLESFTNIKDVWRKNYQERFSNEYPNVYKVIFACKSDIVDERRVVTAEQGQNMATELGYDFFEVSAKDSTGIEPAFFSMALELMKNIQAKADEEAAAAAHTSTDTNTVSESEDTPVTVFMNSSNSSE